MKIAFLQAGFPPPELNGQYGNYLTMFQTAFKKSNNPIDWVNFPIQKGELPGLDENYDGYLCCGSANSVYDEEPWINPLIKFVQKVEQKNSPMVGICFGHQLIAQAFGGRVEKANQGWGLGHRSGIILTSDRSWMNPPKKSIDLLYSHQDQVTKLPKGAKLLLKTEHCPLAGFEIGNRFLTFQGHPEFEPEYLLALMESRREPIGSHLVDQAKINLIKTNDNQLVTGWISHFFKNATAHL
jgi:GMP synthase-like glutamine amidotransferase